MNSPWSMLATQTLADHEIIVFYAVDGFDPALGPAARADTGETLPAACPDLAAGLAALLPPDQPAALAGRYADATLWRQSEPDERGHTTFQFGEDLHPHVRDVLSGARPDLATRWLPTEPVDRLLKSADLYEEAVAAGDRIRRVIGLIWSKAARRRLQEHGVAPRGFKLEMLGLELTLFATGKGLMQVRLALAPLDDARPPQALELLEAAYALSRFNSFVWRRAAAPHDVAGPAFTLGQLMRGLCFPRAEATRVSGRAFTHVFARFAGALPIEEADLFALYAARRYTTDYTVAPGAGGFRRLRDFVNVGHVVALEGGATVIASPDGAALPDFLQTFKPNTLHAHYAPILTLARHEHAFLVEMTSSALLTPAARRSAKTMRETYARLVRESLQFRVLFRYSEVSRISLHNALNHALRAMLGLDVMLSEFHADVAEISALLEREGEAERHAAELARERRFWGLGVLGAALLAALSVSAFVKQLVENGLGLWGETAAGKPAEIAALWGVAAAVLTFAVSVVLGIRKGPPDGGAEAEGFNEIARHLVVERAQERE